MDLGLTDKVAVVTGAARGIGAAIAYRLQAEGSLVYATDVIGGACDVDAASRGGMEHFRTMDVVDRDQVSAVFAAIEAEAGRVDILVNNAGIVGTTPFVDTSPNDWDRLLAVNLTGIYNCCRAVIPGMVARGFGRIVSLASVAAMRGGGTVGNIAYGVSKAGVVALTKGLARELGPHGITANAIAPALVDSDMVQPFLTPALREQARLRIPLRRLGTVDDIAQLAAFLASDAASFVTGETVAADGGLLKV